MSQSFEQGFLRHSGLIGLFLFCAIVIPGCQDDDAGGKGESRPAQVDGMTCGFGISQPESSFIDFGGTCSLFTRSPFPRTARSLPLEDTIRR